MDYEDSLKSPIEELMRTGGGIIRISNNSIIDVEKSSDFSWLIFVKYPYVQQLLRTSEIVDYFEIIGIVNIQLIDINNPFHLMERICSPESIIIFFFFLY